MNYLEQKIRDIWFGRELLWKVFWIYKILIGGSLGLVFELLYQSELKTLSALVLAVYCVFHVFALQGLLTCRRNSKYQNILPNLVIGFVGVNVFFLAILVCAFFLKIIY